MTSQPDTSGGSAASGPEQERARVRSYLVSQAEKYDLVDLWPRIIGQRLALIQSLDGVSDDQARWRPPHGDGEEAWGILEVAQHVAGWTDNVIGIVRGLSGGEPVEKAPVGHLEADMSRSVAEVRRDLIAATMRLAAEMHALTAAPAWSTRTADHALFGPLNARAWLLFQRIHDTDHINQIAALKGHGDFPDG